ncbi:MAG: zeta toxin family protein [Myxococcales bacterium]|nr:zeta toxin family protein [Myxococcales bacterium]
MKPQLVLLAGPNGAGKSTFYRVYLQKLALPFLNADVLAAETGIDSLEAAAILDQTRDRMIVDDLGFITETVFSDPVGAKVAMLRRAVAAGFDVTLLYIGVASPELSRHRVDQRIARGGHSVPPEKLAARFNRSLANLKVAVTFVPNVKLYDNSSADQPFQPIATFSAGVMTWRRPGALPRWTRGIVPTQRRNR